MISLLPSSSQEASGLRKMLCTPAVPPPVLRGDLASVHAGCASHEYEFMVGNHHKIAQHMHARNLPDRRVDLVSLSASETPHKATTVQNAVVVSFPTPTTAAERTMMWSGGRACRGWRGWRGTHVGLRTQVHPAARPYPGTCRLRGSQLSQCKALPVFTGGGTSSVAAGSPNQSVLSAPVQERWDQVLPNVQVALGPNTTSKAALDKARAQLRHLQALDCSQPQLLAWHVLPQLRPFMQEELGTRWFVWDASSFIALRAARHGDYSPLVWALGLQQRVAPATSSPLPPPPDPPFSDGRKAQMLVDTLKCVATINDHGQHLLHMQIVLQQLQQQQPDVLGHSQMSLWVWRVCAAAKQPSTFWQLLQNYGDLRWAAVYMLPELHVWEVQPVAEGFIQSGLLADWKPVDIWRLAAQLDNAAGDRDRMLQVFGTLALQAPHHPAFDCLGALLLQLASNARRCSKVSYPRGQFGAGIEDVDWSGGRWEVMASDVLESVIPHLTCRLTAPEVVEWVTRLQLVWPPAQTHRLLLQLLSAPNSRKVFKVKGLLQLYDLLLQQLARPGWEPQQQAAMLPSAAGDAVLTALRDASKSRAAAVKVMVVWRHMCGGLDPAWSGAELAAPSLQHHLEELQASGFTGVGSMSAAGNVRHQLLQQLSSKGQQQVRSALQQLGLQVELLDVSM